MCHLLSKKRRTVEITVSIANYTKRRAVRYEYAEKRDDGEGHHYGGNFLHRLLCHHQLCFYTSQQYRRIYEYPFLMMCVKVSKIGPVILIS